MVKNQNWQKRVETADARRKEAKQRKQSKQTIKLHKRWGQEFMSTLERHSEKLESRVETIDVWSDKCGDLNSGMFMEQQQEEYVRSRRRSRAASMDSTQSTGSSHCHKRRGRSYSVSENRKNEKGRRKESFSEEQDDVKQLLCKSHFFKGRCSHDGKKGGGCKHVHYPPDYKTLHQALKNTVTPEELDFVERAVSVDDQSPHAVEMVHHACFQLQADSEQSLYEQLTAFLLSAQISLASLVYVSMGGVLVYDRNREGLLARNDREFLMLVLGEDAMLNRKFSTASQHEEGSQETLVNFPAAVLEHILTFLPDTAVAAACLVCHPWHDGIGQHSPNLWRHLLQRRNWPLPDDSSEPSSTTMSSRDMFRNAFINHYTVIRDMTALQNGLMAIKTKKTVKETEMTYQDFSKRNNAPSIPNGCVSVRVWSPNRVLAAYSRDCTLRLYGATSKGVAGTDEKQCRELVCHSIDPYKTTRRKRSGITSMDLDDDCIGCLCFVSCEDGDMEDYTYNLVVVNRNDFLVCESSDTVADTDLNLTVIDINEAVIGYLLSEDEFDHRLLPLTNFLQSGGELHDVEVFASDSLVACGHGRFMVELSISIPEEEIEGELLLLVRKLVLFSTELGAVFWTGESNPMVRPMPAVEHVSLSSVRYPYPGGTDIVSTVVSRSLESSEFTVCEIDVAGLVQSAVIHEPLNSIIAKLRKDGWNSSPPVNMRDCILISPTHVITLDYMIRGEVHAIEGRRSFLTFYPREALFELSSLSSIEIPGRNIEVMRMTCIRNNYIIVVCRAFTDTSRDALEERGGGGHWLRGQQSASATLRIDIQAYIYHIPTRYLVGQFCLLEDVGRLHDIPRLTPYSEDTLSVGLCWDGLVMTGSDVRCVNESAKIDSSPRSSKKKKKGRAKRRAKKDEFARGMRQNSG